MRHRADRRGDRHLVVVEDHEHPAALGAGVVHRLVGHAGADGAVADHSDDVAGRLAEVAGNGEAEPGGDRGRGVCGAEGVVGAFGALGEAGEAAFLAQGADAVAAAGDDLVRIALVADVPDQLVVGRVEDGVDGDGQLDDAEAGTEMAAGLGDGGDQFGAKLVGEGGELVVGHAPQVGRRLHEVEEGGLWPFRSEMSHSSPPFRVTRRKASRRWRARASRESPGAPAAAWSSPCGRSRTPPSDRRRAVCRGGWPAASRQAAGGSRC